MHLLICLLIRLVTIHSYSIQHNGEVHTASYNELLVGRIIGHINHHKHRGLVPLPLPGTFLHYLILTHSRTYSLTYLLTHLLTHSLTQMQANH